MSRARLRPSILALIFGVGLLPGAVDAAPGDFVEDDVQLLWQAQGEPGSQFGWAVAELPDIDGDGAMEAVVGAPAHDEGDGPAGLLVVLSGRTGDELFRFNGAPGASLGYAMSDAGDVDGDGLHDIAVGAPAEASTGRVYVYSGLDGQTLLTLDGEEAGDFFGAALAGPGDIDGDGYDDVLVGAPRATPTGRAYVISGEDGSTLLTLDGPAPGLRFGSATAPVGDLNGDEVPDLFVGDRDAGKDSSGRAYVLSGANGSMLFTLAGGKDSRDFGWFFVATIGDASGDGIPDLYVGDFASVAGGNNSGHLHLYSGADGSELLNVVGAGAGQGLGPGRGAGDVDGDGRPDIAGGSYISSDGAPQAGKINLFSGTDGTILRTITSLEPGEQLGFDAVGMGDVDGDGRVDLLAAAANGNAVYLVAGTLPKAPPPPPGGTTTGAGDESSGGGANEGDDTSTPGNSTEVDSEPGEGGGGLTTSPAADPEEASGCSCSASTPFESPWPGVGLGLLVTVLLVTRRVRG